MRHQMRRYPQPSITAASMPARLRLHTFTLAKDAIFLPAIRDTRGNPHRGGGDEG